MPRPTSKILMAGIVCIDISSLSGTPKAVSGKGKSGDSLRGLLDALRSMSLGERPTLVILECVPRLTHHRKVDPDQRTGAEFILDELSKLGYVGEWRILSPRNFGLPQSRDRAYSLNLLRDDFTEVSAQKRRQDLGTAFQMLQRMQLSKFEPLARVLQRLPSTIAPPRKQNHGQSLEEAKASGKKWPHEHAAWASALGVTQDARTPPPDFVKEVSPFIPPRGVHAMWLKLVRLQMKSGKDWKQPLLIVPTGFSVAYARARRRTFPCVTPGQKYVILESGKARLATGLTAMALQGIQKKEVRHYQLATEHDQLLRDLAGNAFTANIAAAFLMAGASVM
jgi:site-specific DNA-cytosine methylase